MHVCLTLENPATPSHPVIVRALQTMSATHLAD